MVSLPVREQSEPLEEGDRLLVWTTTPWTLISNAAVAVGPQIEYARARPSGSEEVFVLAEPLVVKVLGEGAEVLARFPGSALAGAAYEPPFDYVTDRTTLTTPAGPRQVPMRWYGEYLWRADWPGDVPAGTPYRVCATDAAGLSACSPARQP